jgi:hypothetical protein
MTSPLQGFEKNEFSQGEDVRTTPNSQTTISVCLAPSLTLSYCGVYLNFSGRSIKNVSFKQGKVK